LLFLYHKIFNNKEREGEGERESVKLELGEMERKVQI
jgi:hypothetical protein